MVCRHQKCLSGSHPSLSSVVITGQLRSVVHTSRSLCGHTTDAGEHKGGGWDFLGFTLWQKCEEATLALQSHLWELILPVRATNPGGH